MRLLQLQDASSFSSVEFDSNNCPPYAILSHTWGADSEEVTFQDLINCTGKDKGGYRKLIFCGQQAAKDGLQHFWVDTCCIDKSSSAELSEAINSMWRWYRDAERCYVHLADVLESYPEAFRHSRWFTRGWTLQELLAPKHVEFFSSDWKALGDRNTYQQDIHAITGIPVTALWVAPMSDFSVEQRMSWAGKRRTKREEDQAYSLLGLFGVHMPLLYGEGEAKAMRRLQREIAEKRRLEEVHQRSPNPSTATGHAFFNHESSSAVLTPESELENPTSAATAPIQEQDVMREAKEPHAWSYHDTLIEDGFRILIIEPGMMGSTITCRIQVCSLLAPPPYNALSYCWGQEPAIHQILINDKLTLIRPNLFHALQRIRALQTEPIRMWADSICINQQNESERNAQVRRMAQIYNGAEGVFIWLGEEDASSKLALEFVTQVYEKTFSWVGAWWKDYGFETLGRLLDRPWFQRGWVVQEAAFSTNSIIQCGDSQVYMDHFAAVMDAIQARLNTKSLAFGLVDSRNRAGSLVMNSPAVKMLDMIEGAFSKSAEGEITQHRQSLETLVHLSTFSETSDERDSIYALLNIANDTALTSSTQESDSIHPDYGKSVLDVYVDFILHCYRQSYSLDILCRPWAPPPSTSPHSQWKKDRFDNSVVPSWVCTRDTMPYGNPILRLKHRLYSNPLVGSSQKRRYNATHRMRPNLRIGRNDKKSCNGSIIVKGIVLAQISRRSTRMANAIVTRECLELLGSVSRKAYSRNIVLPDAIWRTLCADRDERGDPATSSFRVAMLDLLHMSLEDREALDATNVLENMSSIDIEEMLEMEIPEHIRNFLLVVRDTVWNRRTFRSLPMEHINRPLVGLAPQKARIGDYICILYGCSVPLVIRNVETSLDSWWDIVGEAYVHGVMDGEIFQQTPETILKELERDFIIW